MMSLSALRQRQDGQVLITLVIVIPATILIVAAYMSLSVNNYQLARADQFRTQSQMTADAGADYAIQQVNQDKDWPGTSGEVTLQSDSAKKTTYDASVTTDSSTSKTLTVIGRTYFPASAANATSTVTLKVNLVALTSGTGPTSVSTGVGGLILNNNAKISGGDVVVNGKITLGNNAQIGLTTNSVNVRSAHQSCPTTAPYDTYPQVCGAGNGEPITLGTNAKIYANVQAKNQTTGTNMFNPGLVACSGTNCNPVSLPTYGRAAQKAAVTSTYASSDGAIACGNNASKSWPANVKITGNITTGNNCTVTINGDVWITGSVTMGNGSKFVVADSLGTTMPTMMLDGGNASGTGGFIFGNNSQILPNISGTGLQVVSFWSDSSCSPDCASLTGTELHDSQNITTINLSNNGSAPNSILWSHWTKVKVANNGAIGAVAGQTVELGSNAIINFTSSVPGSDNRVTTWVKRGYMQIY
jgi:hypothetical protein